MRRPRDVSETAGRYEVLRNLLETAQKIAGDLADDPLIERLFAVFARMPAEDREAVLGILEREVDARLLTDAADTMAGIHLRPNPSTRIYVRVIDQEEPLNRAETVAASVRAMRLFHRAVGPAPEVWEANMLGALQELDDEELATIGSFVQLLADLIKRCRRARSRTPGG